MHEENVVCAYVTSLSAKKGNDGIKNGRLEQPRFCQCVRVSLPKKNKILIGFGLPEGIQYKQERKTSINLSPMHFLMVYCMHKALIRGGRVDNFFLHL